MENDSVELNIRQLLVRRSVLAARSIIHCLRVSADAGSEPPRSASRVVTLSIQPPTPPPNGDEAVRSGGNR